MARSVLAGLIRRLLETRVDRDGQSAELEAAAGLFASPVEGPVDIAGRRDRAFGLPADILERSLAQKVLNSWLQNRHQVLVPLTFRLSRLSPEDVGVLMQFAAAALLNGSSVTTPAIQATELWLREVGAGEAGVASFRAAQAAPTPLSTLLATIAERSLQPYAYAAAVVAADTREPSGHLFANYIAARLALPADAVRSIDRRFRR